MRRQSLPRNSSKTPRPGALIALARRTHVRTHDLFLRSQHVPSITRASASKWGAVARHHLQLHHPFQGSPDRILRRSSAHLVAAFRSPCGSRWIFGGLFIALYLRSFTMSLFPFFHWLQQTDFGTALRESALVYRPWMASHLSGMALFGGLIFMTDLRILRTGDARHFRIRRRESVPPLETPGAGLSSGCALCSPGPKPNITIRIRILGQDDSLTTGRTVHAMVFRKSVLPTTPPNSTGHRSCPLTPKWLPVSRWPCGSGLVSMGRMIGYYEIKP